LAGRLASIALRSTRLPSDWDERRMPRPAGKAIRAG
jgi:hypothetical protein